MSFTIDDLGIYRPKVPVLHRDDEYSESGFEALRRMQSKHFWYIGRHKFLMGCLQKHLNKNHQNIIDLGGGVGGWIRYLLDHSTFKFEEIALGDSSDFALIGARQILPKVVDIYQVDLMAMDWQEKWDIVFLLDVIEHCPDDVSILNQVYDALKPGGLLIVSTPALEYFWSYNDEYAKHLRRYSISDYKKLASMTKFTLIDARYFMFFLSPLYWLSRKLNSKHSSEQKIKMAIQKEHEVPQPILNFLLSAIFLAESPLGNYVNFPWGTSVLGVFSKK